MKIKNDHSLILIHGTRPAIIIVKWGFLVEGAKPYSANRVFINGYISKFRGRLLHLLEVDQSDGALEFVEEIIT